MTIEERKNIILTKIEEMKANGEDMENALGVLKVNEMLEANVDG